MDLNEFWSHRRTVRQYSSRNITDEQIADMVEKAAHAPNTGNMQLYSVVVTRDKATLERLAPAHFNQPAMTGAPLVLTFCADCRRFEHWCKLSDAETGLNNFQGFAAAMIDATIFAQQFVTIAETSGLGCCYLGTTTYNAPMIADVLRLPKLVVPIVSISLGYPQGSAPVSDRLPVEAIMHKDTYHEATDNDIRAWYAATESTPDAIRFTRENDCETLAQVFTRVRYPKEQQELYSKVYADFIAAAGFPSPET